MLNMDKPQGMFAIRMRIVELNLMYQNLLHQQPEDGTWDWWIKNAVSELQADLAVGIEEMTAPAGCHWSNIIENQYSNYTVPLQLPQVGA